MNIFKIEVENFRLLKNFSIDLEKTLSLVIGKNNTGKTSILTVLDKFINEKSKITFDDFNIEFKQYLEQIVKDNELKEEFTPIGLKLKIYIEYNDTDDLSNVSQVIMDLDPENNIIVLGFEFTLNYNDFKDLKLEYKQFLENEEKKVIDKKKSKPSELKDFLYYNLNKYFRYHKKSFLYDKTSEKANEKEYIDIEKEGISLKDIISYKYISARRDVTNKDNANTLSKQTSVLYKRNEDNNIKNQATEDFIDQLSETDNKLGNIYKDIFESVIEKIKKFGGLKLNDTEIEIISTLQHRELLEGNTTVVYTHDAQKLPEHFNGLGYMNLISTIFEIEILIQEFKRDKEKKPADINLLIIEEPEAHTHPQMQYVFIKNIKKLLAEGIKREDETNRPLQYIITTHSSHIVSESDFDDIKYLKAEAMNSVISKNLSDLSKQYDADPKQYQFLKQYLTISRAEIFFADKAILIEGDTERILMPTFMKKIDLEVESIENGSIPLLSQNISIIEVGAYAQIFEKFIKFVGIKTLIVTDIDSVGDLGKKDDKGNIVFESCPVGEGKETSNSALNHFLKDIKWENLQTLLIDKRTIKIGSSDVCLCYQLKEKGYHARSFEDAFIHINLDFINSKKEKFQGLQNIKMFNDSDNSAYALAVNCIKKKTHFALDILFHSDEDFGNWDIPNYIKEGLLWLKKD